MKKIEFNFKYTDDNKLKDNKKSSKMSEFLKAFFITLVVTVLIELLKLFVISL